MLTEVCKVWDVFLGFFCSFSEHWTVRVNFAELSTPGRILALFQHTPEYSTEANFQKKSAFINLVILAGDQLIKSI